MKLDQIAYYCRTAEAEAKVKSLLGLTDAPWVKDTVTSLVSVWPVNRSATEMKLRASMNVADLQFCYKLGMEFEIIRYIEGPHWLDCFASNPEPFVAHVGLHLDDGEEFPAMDGCRIAQEAFTMHHTAPELNDGPMAGRKYHYRIFELSPGNFIKYIRRRYPGDTSAPAYATTNG